MMNRRWICAGAGAFLLAGGMGAVSAQAAAGHGAGGAQRAVRVRDEGLLPETTALQVTAPGPPRFVYGSDGRTHVDYDLVITNAFTAGATLRSLTVSSGGTTLLRLTGGALAEHTHEIFPGPPSARIPASATRVTLVDVVLPRSAGRHAPRRLTNRIDYTIPPNAKHRAVIGSTTVHGPALRTVRRGPVVIAPPLRGAWWIDFNGCCADTNALHRSTVTTANGTYVTPEMFSIDWIQVVHGSIFRGSNGKHLSDYFGFGKPIYAVANGVVVETISNRPETPPFTDPAAVQKPKDYAGNEVIEKIGPGLYAVYDHLKTGSVMVRRGQHLRTGQPIGKLGSTGNSTNPHLHFSIQDGPDALTANSVPFEINHYTVRGLIPPRTVDQLRHIIITGPPRRERRSYPLDPSAEAFATRPGH